MTHIRMGYLFVAIAFIITSTSAHAYQFKSDEADHDALYAATDIQLTGRVVDSAGSAVVGASVSLLAWGENAANHGVGTYASTSGSFVLTGLARRNALMVVAASGYYTEILPVDLQRPLAEAAVDIGDVRVVPRLPGRARLIFAGDTMLARKFLDSDGDGNEGESGDLLQAGSLASDTEHVFRFVRDVLATDDHTSVNLETAVTASTGTPHPTKSHVFHTYPESLSVFPQVGIESVGLGNNHVYDYLETGFHNTVSALTSTGLGYYGGGLDETDARGNRHYVQAGTLDIAMQGFEEMTGTHYGGDDLHIVAKDSPIVKGGALKLTGWSVGEFVTEEAPARFTVPVFHGGTEYEYFQTAYMRHQFREAIDQGASMVIAHHPHYAHGVSVYDGGDGPRYIFGSLGNFVFDMGIYETLRSYLAVVDVDYHPTAPRVSRVRLVPLRLDDYTPRLLAGTGLTRMGRHLGHLSTREGEPGDGIVGATVFPEGGQIVVTADPDDFTTDDASMSRQLAVTGGETGTFEFDATSPADYLAAIHSDQPATCEVGKDLVGIGGFEDQDVDEESQEGDRWARSSTHFVQNSVTRSGTSAAVILRESSNNDRSVMWVYNRVEVTPGKKLTITGFHKGNNAGLWEVAVRYYRASGSSMGTDTHYQHEGGTHDWTRFTVDVTVPSDADSMKVYFRGYPPDSGEAEYFIDDVGFVEWDDQVHDALTGAELATPNDWGYLRCTAGGSSGSGTLDLDLTHRTYQSAY